jgi:hypothetical protein
MTVVLEEGSLKTGKEPVPEKYCIIFHNNNIFNCKWAVPGGSSFNACT